MKQAELVPSSHVSESDTKKSRQVEADKAWVTATSLAAALLLSVALSTVSLGVWP